MIRQAQKDFKFFYNFVWGYSIELMEKHFCTGDHLNDWCDLFQNERLLSILSARKHSKSEITHAYLAWRIFRMDYKPLEKWLYISYTSSLAEEHIAETKERINCNPMFAKAGIVDLTDAKTILYYRKGANRFFCSASGIQTFKRGKHPDGVITDDILRDPEVKLDVSQIIKINKIFFEQVMSLPKEGGLGVKNIGTPQDSADLFHELEKREHFCCVRYPAYLNKARSKVLWEEMYPVERLRQIEDEIGSKAFGKEYMCVPVRSGEGYLDQERIEKLINPHLKNRKYYEAVTFNEYCFGGLDIGKKRHPSHLSVYGRNRKKRFVQVASIWMDHTDYIRQLEICRSAIENFGIQRLFYDDTRAEFESFREEGTLPSEMKGVCFTQKEKFKMAAEFGKEVEQENISFLSDDRQKRQMLNVDNDLKSMETSEGHGDSFWSNALAISAAMDTGACIVILD